MAQKPLRRLGGSEGLGTPLSESGAVLRILGVLTKSCSRGFGIWALLFNTGANNNWSKFWTKQKHPTKNLNFKQKLADFSFKTPGIRCSRLVRRSLSYSRPNPWGSNPVLSRLKINVQEEKRNTFLNHLTFRPARPNFAKMKLRIIFFLAHKMSPVAIKVS